MAPTRCYLLCLKEGSMNEYTNSEYFTALFLFAVVGVTFVVAFCKCVWPLMVDIYGAAAWALYRKIERFRNTL